MAGFSYKYNESLFLDHANLPGDSIRMAPSEQLPGDLTNNSPSSLFFPCNYSPDAITEVTTNTNDVRAYESCNSLDTTTRITSSDRNKVRLREEVQNKQCSVEKKRKKNSTPMPFSSTAFSNDSKKGKKRNQKKCGNGLKDTEKSPVADGSEEKQQQQQPLTGYIHVRARRGQATDSHSLAERVRREKISERMKLLQGLVPGCDKVIGKALMLDEIINYVQSLQNQVEFLSLKLASISPSLFQFGLNLDDHMVHAQDLNNHWQKSEDTAPPVSSVQNTTHIQPTSFAEATDNYPMDQDSFGKYVDGQSQNFHHQFQFNMSSFQ